MKNDDIGYGLSPCCCRWGGEPFTVATRSLIDTLGQTMAVKEAMAVGWVKCLALGMEGADDCTIREEKL